MRLRGIFVISLLVICYAHISGFSYSAKAVCLMDMKTGEMVYGYNEHARMRPASITKIVTAITALEMGKPEDIVTVDSSAAGTEGSSMYLKSGEKISLEHSLYGLMLHSGNDAANAIAHHFGYEEFVEKMNEVALRVGAVDTHFENPSGLDGDNHMVTAYDMAKITAYAMQNPVFSKIAGTKEKKLVSPDGNVRYLKNHNKLLWQYDNTIGGKTGFTKKAGRTLVSCADDGEKTYICVTLNAPDDWNDHISLYKSYLKSSKKEDG